MAQSSNFKNTYVVNLNELSKHPFTYLNNGIVLPVENKNGQKTDEEFTIHSNRADRCIKQMCSSYPMLSQIIGDIAVRTVIEYVNKSGRQVMILYPTNENSLITNDWSNTDPDILPDAHKIINERKKVIEKMKKHTLSK